MDDIRNMSDLIGEHTYDIVLMDPPWENKHVKRTLKRQKTETNSNHAASSNRINENRCYNTYEMLENDVICQQLPIDQLLSPNGLAAIYCTNSKRHQTALSSWLQHWKLVHVTRWYWLKVNYYTLVSQE